MKVNDVRGPASMACVLLALGCGPQIPAEVAPIVAQPKPISCTWPSMCVGHDQVCEPIGGAHCTKQGELVASPTNVCKAAGGVAQCVGNDEVIAHDDTVCSTAGGKAQCVPAPNAKQWADRNSESGAQIAVGPRTCFIRSAVPQATKLRLVDDDGVADSCKKGLKAAAAGTLSGVEAIVIDVPPGRILCVDEQKWQLSYDCGH